MKKAVFFDIDGPLWDGKMRVPKSTADAIHALRKNGSYAFLCSGRSRAAIRAKELLTDIGFDGILAGCGTYIEYEGDIIYERTLSNAELDELMGIFGKYKTPIVLEGKRYLYADMAQFDKNAYIMLLKEALGDGFQPLDQHMGRYDANKMTAYFTQGDFQALQRDLSGRYELLCHTEEIFEILPKGFSKASGIRRICDHLGILHEGTYAFGDSVNDIEMLSYVRHGISMGNGTDAAKEAADYVTSDLWEDGVKNGLTHFGLI